MYYVYILHSINNPNETYIGSSSDLKKRLESHNSGANKYTSKFKPWKVIWYCAFSTQEKAEAFEKYLKSASGIAFRRKRLVEPYDF
ncbi:MAG: GIY-YIG nuclease family protein [Candidatus Yanofskybacteria bacterium]|nr:GIY-YIG nuclease family protein [Candidatus Yanofskybacteria bacterium]